MSIYSKQIDKLTFDDIEELLNSNSSENLRLEFKLIDPSKDEILKKISSFANTYGGFIVIGVEADSETGKIISIPGVEKLNNFKQRITDWCYDSVTPPIRPFISNDIENADTKRFFYIICIEESLEAPHFLNGRKGVYIRTDEFSKKFEPKLATNFEIQYLTNRREKSEKKLNELFERSEKRFNEYIRTSYTSIHYPSGSIGSTLKIWISPSFPICPIIDQSSLIKLLETTQFSFRQVGYPRINEPLSSYESVSYLEAASTFSILEATTWGTLYYATEVEIKNNEISIGIKLASFAGYILMYILHAKNIFEKFGYNGGIKIKFKMEKIQGIPLLHFPNGLTEKIALSKLDNEIEFDLICTSKELNEDSDKIVKNILKIFFFSINWSDGAERESNIDTIIESGKKANFWIPQ